MIHHRFAHRKRLSMSAALSFAPGGSDVALVVYMTPGAYNDQLLMDVLGELHTASTATR